MTEGFWVPLGSLELEEFSECEKLQFNYMCPVEHEN